MLGAFEMFFQAKKQNKTIDSAIERLVVNRASSAVSSASYEKSDAGLNHDTNPIKMAQKFGSTCSVASEQRNKQ